MSEQPHRFDRRCPARDAEQAYFEMAAIERHKPHLRDNPAWRDLRDLARDRQQTAFENLK